jgi:hypothetical protein
MEMMRQLGRAYLVSIRNLLSEQSELPVKFPSFDSRRNEGLGIPQFDLRVGRAARVWLA